MKTEREQIREMADSISYKCMQSSTCDGCFALGRVCSDYKTAEKLYKAGYRKATEVIDEFMERLKQDEESVKIGNEWKAVVRDVDIERIAAEMRQEVEK